MQRFACRVGGGGLEFCFLSRRMPPAQYQAIQDMPTYEYHCEKCEKNFEVFQSMRDATFTECPREHCQMKKWGHGKVKRLLGTGAGLIFKGSGFYITDYRSKSYQEAAKKDVPASSTSTSEKSSGKKEGTAADPGEASREQKEKRRMMQATEEIILVCPECRRENEAERIYCHDCGARLDRSKVAKLKAHEEDPKETQKRVKAMLDGRRAKRKQLFFLSAKMILGAYLVAGLIQIFRPPDLPPRASTSVAELPPQINLDLENATMDPRGAVLPYSEDQINAYLSYALKSKQTALSQYLKFERLALRFEEGTVKVTMERSLYGYSIFTTGVYAVSLENGNVRFQTRGGEIGRLQVHPKLMQFGDILFADLRTALERERKMIGKLSAIELHPKQVVFVAKQAQK